MLIWVLLQRSYENPSWYIPDKNQIIIPKEAQKKVKQKQIKKTIDRFPSTFHYIFKDFVEGRNPPVRNTWLEDLARRSEATGIEPDVSPKTPRGR